MKSTPARLLLVALLLLGSAVPGFADKTSVRIEAPGRAQAGSTVTVQLHVSHSGNNVLHYTNWLKVSLNGEEAQRWEFSAFNRPEDERFTRQFTFTPTETTEIVAEGNCNMHGNTGAARWVVEVEQAEEAP